MDNKINRILCVHSGGKTLRGSEWALLDILSALNRLNIQILLLCDQTILVKKATEMGINSTIIPYGEIMVDPPDLAIHPIQLLKSNIKVWSKIKSFRPDIVYCNSGRALQMSLAAIKFANIPSAVHLHAQYNKRYLYLYGITKADVTIHCSEKTRLFHEKKAHFKKSVALKNAALVENLPPIETLMRDKTQKEPVIGFYGSLVHRKGLDILIDAFSATLKSGRNCRLKIGGHEQNDIYRNQVTNLGIQGHVEFTGEVPRDKTSDFFSNVNLHVLPSRDDAMPLSIIEAAMCGVPTIAHDVGGISEALLEGELGTLYNTNTAESLHKIICDILDEGTLLSEAHCQRVAQAARTEFSVENNSKKIVSIFESIV